MNLANKQLYFLRSINIQLPSLSFGLKGDAAASYCLYAMNGFFQNNTSVPHCHLFSKY